ncbi:MAG: hypothetical protein ACI8VE_002093, partial [Natrialbaceae archaeon]
MGTKKIRAKGVSEVKLKPSDDWTNPSETDSTV